MRCSYCGKELHEGDKFCPNCAEPVKVEKDDVEVTPRERWLWQIWFRIGMLSIPIVLVWVCWIIFAKTIPIMSILVCGGLEFIMVSIGIHYSNDKQKEIINNQFLDDPTSICPKCGSHNIKVYRQGYDWNDAFWGEILGFKGSRYTAGMNSNHLRCRCMNCGKDWDSWRDYRLK